MLSKVNLRRVFRGRDPKKEKKLDPTPLAMPMGYSHPTPLQDIIAKMVRQAVEEEKGGEFETLGEADDFNIDDDELLDLSPYEFDDLVEEEPLNLEPDPPPETAQAEPEAPQEKEVSNEGETPESDA